MNAVKLLGEIVIKTAELTKDNDSIGCAKLVVFAMLQMIIHLWQEISWNHRG